MSGQFTADPVVLDDNGTKLQTKAVEFKTDVTAIYNTENLSFMGIFMG